MHYRLMQMTTCLERVLVTHLVTLFRFTSSYVSYLLLVSLTLIFHFMLIIDKSYYSCLSLLCMLRISIKKKKDRPCLKREPFVRKLLVGNTKNREQTRVHANKIHDAKIEN